MIIDFFLGKSQRWAARQQREELQYFIDMLKGIEKSDIAMCVVFCSHVKNTMLNSDEFTLRKKKHTEILWLGEKYREAQKNGELPIASGIAVWIHTLRAQKEASNIFVANELWTILASSFDEVEAQVNNIHNFMNIDIKVNIRDIVPDFIRISEEVSYPTPLLENGEIELNCRYFLNLFINYKNKSFSRKSEVENWANENGLDFTKHLTEEYTYEMMFKNGIFKEIIVFRIEFDIKKSINFILHFDFFEKYYGISGSVLPGLYILVDLDEKQLLRHSIDNDAKLLFDKLLKNNEVKDLKRIFD